MALTGEERCELWARKQQQALRDWIARFEKARLRASNERQTELLSAIDIAKSMLDNSHA